MKIEDYGLIGDLRTTALVGRDGRGRLRLPESWLGAVCASPAAWQA